MIDWTINKNNVILAAQVYNELILPNKDKFNNSLFTHTHFRSPINNNIEMHSYEILDATTDYRIYINLYIDTNTNNLYIKNLDLHDDVTCCWCLNEKSEFKRGKLKYVLKNIEKNVHDGIYSHDWSYIVINNEKLHINIIHIYRMISSVFTSTGLNDINNLDAKLLNMIKEFDKIPSIILKNIIQNAGFIKSKLKCWNKLYTTAKHVIEKRGEELNV